MVLNLTEVGKDDRLPHPGRREEQGVAMARIKAVIFDMDGVIINSEPLHYEVDKIVLNRRGRQVEDAYLDKFVGFTNRAMWDVICRELSLEDPPESLEGEQLALKLALLKEKEFHPIEGIPELMTFFRERGVRIGLASSSPRAFIEGVLDKLGLTDFIEEWESGEHVERSKPAPDVFLHVAKKLDVKPEKCLVIEDSRSGVTAAKAAGMVCVGFVNPHSGKQDLSRADYRTDKIDEIRGYPLWSETC